MRRVVVALAIAACDSRGSSSTLLTDGLVIGISEGEQRAFQLDRSGVKLKSVPKPLGATINDSNQLVLNVPCDAVPGTTGPAREFQIELDTGTTTVVTVEVHPSGLGLCMPRVIACVHDVVSSKQGTGRLPCDNGSGVAVTRGTSAIDGMKADSCTGTELITGTHIQFEYLDQTNPMLSDLTQPDKALLFHLANPDDSDTGLNFAIATDSPLKTPPSHDDQCVALANANVVGTFGLDWTIVRGTAPSDPLVAAGAWELTWNKREKGMQVAVEQYGLEVVSCATSDVSKHCVPSRQDAQPPTQPPPPTQWCIPADTSHTTAIEMRLWASPAVTGKPQYDIDITATWASGGGGATIDLVADGHRGNPIPVTASAAAIPIPVHVDVDVGNGDLKLSVAATDHANGGISNLGIRVGTCPP